MHTRYCFAVSSSPQRSPCTAASAVGTLPESRSLRKCSRSTSSSCSLRLFAPSERSCCCSFSICSATCPSVSSSCAELTGLSRYASACSETAFCAYSNSSCPLRNTIRSHGMVRRTTFASSRPSINGMRMSVMSTSGFISISIGSAISPSGASPANKKRSCSFSMQLRMPSRMISSSSAINTRIIAFFPPVHPVR